MANGARSSKKLNADDRKSSKRTDIRGKPKDAKVSTTSSSAMTETSGLRRSSRGTPSKNQTSLSGPSSARKSERLEKQSALAIPTTRKSERVGKQRMPSPPRRPERGDKHRPLSSLASKRSEKGSGSLDVKMKNEKREKSGKQVLDDSSSQSKSENQVQTRSLRKKKRLDARSYRLSLARNKKAKTSDHNEQHWKKNNLSQRDSGASTRGSKQVDEDADGSSSKKGDEEEKCFGKGDEEAVEGSSSSPDGTLRNGFEEVALTAAKQKFCCEGAHQSSNTAALPVSKCVDDSLKHSPNELIEKETVTDADRREMGTSRREDVQEIANDAVGCLPRDGLPSLEALPSSEVSLSTSPADGLPTVDANLKQTGDIRTSNKKRNAPDADPVISNTAVSKGTSTPEASSLEALPSSPHQKRSKFETAASSPEALPSSPHQKRSKFETADSSPEALPSSPHQKRSKFETAASCFKKWKDTDSQNQVGSCNATNLCTFLDEVVATQAATVRTQKDEIIGNCFHRDRTNEHIDPAAREELHSAQKLCKHDPIASLTTINNLIFMEEDMGRHEVDDSMETVQVCVVSIQPEESSMENRTETDHNACFKCKLGGKLLCCDGKGCNRSYHLSCLDPPLKEVPPGVWYCLWCIKKKIEFGVHSVSGGVESIWDARDSEVSDHKGVQKEKQCLVKYRGHAHVHNRWIPEKQLLQEVPMLVAKFNRRHQREKAISWRQEWTMPQRLLWKRLLISPEQASKYFGGNCSDFSNCLYEWLVKWTGLGYEHATWELDNSSFLSSPDGMKLISDFENRREKAKKQSDPSRAAEMLLEREGPLSKLSKLPGGYPPGLDDDLLSTVNKLRNCWHKRQNAFVIDDQERIMKVILLILSLESHICRPFLIISTTTALPVWEVEFTRLAPAVNVVVYNGDKDVRKSIRALEFYEEGGCIMFEVLLSSHDAIAEDIDALECLGWEAIVVDECQRSIMSKHFEQIRMLTSDFRLLLINGPIKETISEYFSLLSLLDPEMDRNELNFLKHDSNDGMSTLAVLKDRLERYLAYEHKSDSLKIEEYWVPVQLVEVQLEQYCATLLSNSIALRSCSRNDPVGALRDILVSTRKCCNHPYLVDGSLQGTLTKDLQEAEYLDVGVNASGKLKLLDKILPEIKKQGLRVLMLFQSSIGGSGRNSIGDILDDFLRQRFGADSYERIDSGLQTSKKQAAMTNFNSRERGRFVFLIENRACSPSIKLVGVDTVIIFDSDWHPLNDIRALQKINIDSPFEQLRVFRLYSSCTVEEKVLIFAKQEMALDSNVQNINCTASHMLLIWGASYLFNKLDEFHGCSNPSIDSRTCPELPLLNHTVTELLMQLTHGTEIKSKCNSVILKVQNSRSKYSKNVALHGEVEMHLKDEDVPHVFWTKLLEGRFPSWRFLSAPTQRVRKRVHYFDDPQKRPDTENDEVRKKRKKGVNSTVDTISAKGWLEGKQKAVAEDKEAKIADTATKVANTAATLPDNASGSSYPPPGKTPIFSGSRKYPGANAAHTVESEGTGSLRDAQKNLHLHLKPLILKLCQVLQYPEDVKHMTGRLLEYVMNNHRVSKEPVTIFQAFQISLCWVAASTLGHKVDRKASLQLTKQQLKFECTEEEAESVYSALRMLKKMFKLHASSSTNHSKEKDKGRKPLLRNEDVTGHSHFGRNSDSKGSDKQELEEGEIRETSQSCNSSQQRVFVELESDHQRADTPVPIYHTAERPSSDLDRNQAQNIDFINQCIRRVEKFCAKRTKRILLQQQQEFAEFHKYRETERAKLMEENRLQSNHIRNMHNNLLDRLEKLKELDEIFERKLKEFDRHWENSHRKLVAMQSDARNEENRTRVRWLEEARSGRLAESLRKYPLPESRFRMDYTKTSRQSRVHDTSDIRKQMSVPSSGKVDGDVSVLELAKSTALCTIPANVPAIDSLRVVEVTPPIIDAVSNEKDRMDNIIVEKPRVAGGCQQTQGSFEENSRCKEMVSSVQQNLNEEVTSSAELPKSAGHSDSHLLQVPSVECDAQVASSGSRIEPVPGCEGQTSQQREVPMLQPKDAALFQDNQSSGNNIPFLESSVRAELLPSANAASVEFYQTDPSATIANEQQPTSIGHDPPQQTELPPSTDALSVRLCQTNPSATLASELEPISIECSTLQQTEDVMQRAPVATPLQVDQPNYLPVPAVVQPVLPPHHNIAVEGTPMADPGTAGIMLSQIARRWTDHLSEPLLVSQSSNFPLQPTMQPLTPHPNIPGEGTSVADPGSMRTRPEYSSSRPSQTHPMTARRPPLLHPDPLQNEVAKMHKAKELNFKMHEDEKVRLRSECERELEEVRQKYNSKILDAELMFEQRQKMIETNLKKVDLNRVLADAIKLKFHNINSAAKQALVPTSAQQQSQQPLPQPLQQTEQRPVLGTGPASASAPSQGTSQPVQMGHHSFAHRPALATGPAPGSGPYQAPSQPVQVVHHSSALMSGTPPTAPLVHPHINLQVGAEPRAPAPHLQPFRAVTSKFTPTDTALPSPVQTQQSFGNIPLTSSPLGAVGGTNFPDSPRPLPPFHNFTPSALELLMDFDGRSGTTPPDPGLVLDRLGPPSDVAPECSRRASPVSGSAHVAQSVAVVCLSDDDN